MCVEKRRRKRLRKITNYKIKLNAFINVFKQYKLCYGAVGIALISAKLPYLSELYGIGNQHHFIFIASLPL